MKRTLVREVMTTTVVTASEAMPFRHLVALMHARDIGAVPVTGPERHVLGVVSNADLAARAAGLSAAMARPLLVNSRRRREHRRTTARTAGELMTAPAVTVAPAATVGQAALLMSRRHVGRLPVTCPRCGELAGIVTRSDLLRVYLRPGEEIRAEIEAEVIPLVPGADPRSLTVAVCDGVVTIAGEVERRSAASGVVTAAQQVEGVIHVDEHITFAFDDRHPGSSLS